MSRIALRGSWRWAAILTAGLICSAASHAESGTNSCNGASLGRIPARSPAAPSGAEFVREISAVSDSDREKAIEDEILAGNIPDFLRRLVPVRIEANDSGNHHLVVTICALPDYLAIGGDRDFLFTPMRLATALRIADRFGFTLPTVAMVDAIHTQSSIQLAPQPMPAGDQMRSTDYYWRHTEMILQQRALRGGQLGELTSGDKKDLVITNRLWTRLAQVAIYGWHRLDHSAIQPLSTVHGAHYADYSHGVRLVSAVIYVDGVARSIFDAFDDPVLARLLAPEGRIPRLSELVTLLSSSAQN